MILLSILLGLLVLGAGLFAALVVALLTDISYSLFQLVKLIEEGDDQQVFYHFEKTKES